MYHWTVEIPGTGAATVRTDDVGPLVIALPSGPGWLRLDPAHALELAAALRSAARYVLDLAADPWCTFAEHVEADRCGARPATVTEDPASGDEVYRCAAHAPVPAPCLSCGHDDDHIDRRDGCESCNRDGGPCEMTEAEARALDGDR